MSEKEKSSLRSLAEVFAIAVVGFVLGSAPAADGAIAMIQYTVYSVLQKLPR